MLCVCNIHAQQITPRIAGLEANAEYMSLLREDAVLQMREDSIVHVVSDWRQRFRENPQQREQYSKEILRLEQQIFTLRNTRGHIIDRVGAIEQEWVLTHLDAPQPEVEALPPTADDKNVRNLIHSSYFKEHLAESDHAALKEAQRREAQALDFVNRYLTNYHDLSMMAGMYAVVATEAEAVEIFEKYNVLKAANDLIADSLATTWGYIFDNKNFAYAYLLDKLRQDDILAHEEQLFAEAMQQLSRDRGEYVSDILTDYVLRKRVLVDYEYRIAQMLHLDAARDSLRTVATQLKEMDYRLPKVGVAERYFLDFAAVGFSSPTQYTYANPIPECRIFPRGSIYRILLGTFNTKRAASLFKGAHPLCYHVDEQGKWNYYAGGFATRSEADAAQKLLKAKGFTRPEVVVWRDGIYRNLTRNPEAVVQLFRVEISNITALPEPVREEISAQAPDRELSRIGAQMFVIGPFTDRIPAEALAEAIRLKDPTLEIKVAEIIENKE